MSRLNDLAARRRAAQHTADDALEEADRALVEAQRETIGGVA